MGFRDDEERERQASRDAKYGWGRISHEAAIIRNCEAMGAIHLNRVAQPPLMKGHTAERRTGFTRG